MKREAQTTFEFKSRGGARKGSGRKRIGKLKRVPHRTRGALAARHPVHVTLRIAAGLASLRERRTYSVVRAAILAGGSRHGMRLVHYSVMTNHLHLVCEAQNERALSSGIKGISVRIARAINRLWQRSGRVFADRFHTHVLKTPREVRNALAYVLKNAIHHKIPVTLPDPCSSGTWFEGWRDFARRVGELFGSPLPTARTWLLAHGWRRHGLIEIDPRPGRANSTRDSRETDALELRCTRHPCCSQRRF